jgi:ribosome maturation factor RimP
MAKRLHGIALALMLAGAACSRGTDLEKVPVGSEVQLTRQDGGVVEGKLAARDAQVVKVSVGRTTRAVPRKDIADVRVVDPNDKPAALPPIAKFREYTIPAGTRVSVRLNEAVNSGTSKAGQAVSATLADPVTIDGVQVLPAGSPVRGEVTAADASGKVKGRASLAMDFRSVSAHGESHPLGAHFSMVAPATKKSDAKKIGIPAAGGAIVGAIIGGGKGAAIGAAAGGGAGTAAVLMTPGKEVGLASGAEVAVTTGAPFDVKVPITRQAAK